MGSSLEHSVGPRSAQTALATQAQEAGLRSRTGSGALTPYPTGVACPTGGRPVPRLPPGAAAVIRARPLADDRSIRARRPRIALARAVKSGRVIRNVASLVEPPARRTAERRPLTAEEARAFLAVVVEDRLGALYGLAISTGMRQLLALRWQDVDLDGGRVTIRHTLRLGTRELAEPKTQRARRTLRLGADTVLALREHRRRQLEERLAAGRQWVDGDFVFSTGIGTPSTRETSPRRSSGSSRPPACRTSGSTTFGTPAPPSSSRTAKTSASCHAPRPLADLYDGRRLRPSDPGDAGAVGSTYGLDSGPSDSGRVRLNGGTTWGTASNRTALRNVRRAVLCSECGPPGGIRTPDLLIRSQSL
jgi:hypothetical protein